MSISDEDLKYEILSDENVQFDLSFKLIVIGDSGNNNFIRRRKIMSNVKGD